MEPITTAAVAFALAQGFGRVGSKLLEEGVVKPALEPAVDQLNGWVSNAVVSKKEDEALRRAVRSAMEDYQRITGDTDLQAQTLVSSLNILVAERNSALRAEVARTLWLMDGPDPVRPREIDLLKAGIQEYSLLIEHRPHCPVPNENAFFNPLHQAFFHRRDCTHMERNL